MERILERFLDLMTSSPTLWGFMGGYLFVGIAKHFAYKEGYRDGFRMGRLEEKIMKKDAKDWDE